MDLDFRVDNLQINLLSASSESEALLFIYETWAANHTKTDVLVDELVQLHNKGLINVVKAFQSLENRPDSKVDFFLTRNLFEKMLPKLNSNVNQVMECVLHLVKEAGRDLAAGTIFQPFIAYCNAEASRPLEGLKLIENSAESVIFLAPLLISGSQIDFEYYFKESTRFACNDDLGIRREAVRALGKLKYPENSIFPGKALDVLEASVDRETDDALLAGVIEGAFELNQHDNALASRVAAIIDNTLMKGGDFALYAASVLLGLKYKKLSSSLVEILLNHLQQVNPTHRETLNNIDYGITSLLENGALQQGLEFLEKLLLRNKRDINLEIFDSTCHSLLQNKDNALHRVVTRWLLRGRRELCEGVLILTRLVHGDALRLSVEPSELDISNSDELVFIARKAIGYLFLKPVSAASIVVSLMTLALDKVAIQKLSQLLFDPLLINYAGKVGEYLNEQLEVVDDQNIQEAIREPIKLFESYLEDLRSIGTIRELYPSQEHRERYRRRWFRQLSEAMKNAEKESILLSMIHKSVLLYGRKSISYVYGPDGEARRMEMPMKSFGTEMELPRLENVDPFGLDCMLRIFRAEQMNNNEIDH